MSEVTEGGQTDELEVGKVLHHTNDGFVTKKPNNSVRKRSKGNKISKHGDGRFMSTSEWREDIQRCLAEISEKRRRRPWVAISATLRAPEAAEGPGQAAPRRLRPRLRRCARLALGPPGCRPPSVPVKLRRKRRLSASSTPLNADLRAARFVLRVRFWTR